MMKVVEVSEKKQKLYDKLSKTPIVKGETVYVRGKHLSTVSNSEFSKACVVIDAEVDADHISVREAEYKSSTGVKVNKSLVLRDDWRIGANPFSKIDNVRYINYTLESILFNLDVLGDKGRDTVIKDVHVKELNWNPYVYNKKGKKEYYQRPFVWTTEDNQLLIESIYQGIECGRILVRKRGWHEIERQIAGGEKKVAFADIVDGKQRLNAIRGFVMGEFPDMEGNYYADLSNEAQHKLVNNQLLSFAELPEESKDEHVIEQFLKLNFAGIPQSKEHIEFVKKIKSKL